MSVNVKAVADAMKDMALKKVVHDWKLVGESNNTNDLVQLELYFTPCAPQSKNLERLLSYLSTLEHFSYRINENKEKSTFTYHGTFCPDRKRQDKDQFKAFGMIRP